MTIDYEKEYDNHARVPENPAIAARRVRDAAAYRAAARKAELGLSYGPSPRQIIDLFAAGAEAPLAMFIHGGGWRALDPSSFSHMAAGPNAHGVTVAVVGYDLCPQVTVAAIIEQMRAASLFLWRKFRKRIFVYGHSAGAHLAACLLATDWTALAPEAPADLVPAIYAASGIYDMTPLTKTKQYQVLGLDEQSARAVSPLFWPVPAGRALDAVVGTLETSEFLRQTRSIVETWRRGNVQTRYGEIAGANHFTVVDQLAEAGSAMTGRVVALARQAAAAAR
ncbi:MAG TPA: alpha/beta hydrolase [Pseudolabrys sp.]|nr:alpha/beta hydrolase [Pseudolabrys sp.]